MFSNLILCFTVWPSGRPQQELHISWNNVNFIPKNLSYPIRLYTFEENLFNKICKRLIPYCFHLPPPPPIYICSANTYYLSTIYFLLLQNAIAVFYFLNSSWNLPACHTLKLYVIKLTEFNLRKTHSPQRLLFTLI